MNVWIEKWTGFIEAPRQLWLKDIGLLISRVALGLMMALGHGKGKLDMLLAGDGGKFPDPLGVGNTLSLALAVGGEFFCALALAAGLATRLALTQLIITMAVAAFIIHGADDFGTREMALLYLFPFITLFLTGPGRLSVDHWIVRALGRK